MSQAFKLYRLQQIDLELDRRRARIKEIDASMADNSKEESSLARVDKSRITRDKANKELRSAEQNVQAQRLKIEQTETTLYGGKVTNPKELQELQMEVESFRKYLSVLEDRQLESMLEFDEWEDEFRMISNEHDTLIEQISDQKNQLNEEKKTLLRTIERLEGERQAAISNIREQDLNLYETLRKSKNGVAVAAVLEKTCAACGSTLTAASFSAVHNPNIITHCPTCGRILYLS
jgi:predicted  nucleic acid-binding Zn-ribbon protein